MSKIVMVSTNPATNRRNSDSTSNALYSYIKKISKYPLLSIQEEKELAKAAAKGSSDAKKQLVQSNLKLVVNIVNKTIYSNLTTLDLIQEGNLGLMIAVEKFDYTLGYKFSTYASWWIRQSIFKAISEQSHSVKIPVYIQETLSKFSKTKNELERKYNCSVDNKTVAKEINIEPEKIENYLSAYIKCISIESEFKMDNGKEVKYAEILEDKKASTTDSTEFDNLKSDINMVLSKLKERERDVIMMRFGLGELQKRTLEEIGKIYGVTKECVRQTEIRAVKKLKNNVLLACYLA